MFSIPYLIAQLYPNKNLEEQQRLVDACLNNGKEYYARSWNLDLEDLKTEAVKLNLIKVLHRKQTQSWGIVQEIMSSLEQWSDGTLIFKEFSDEDNLFYKRFYTFLGFLNFAELSTDSQIFLLRTRFLLLAIVWGVPIYTNVQEYFTKFISVKINKEDSILFSKSISNNITPLSVEGKPSHTIQEWVVLFDEFFGSSFENKTP